VAAGESTRSDKKRSAIADFSMLWSLFEARILNTAGSANRICAKVDSWQNAGTLDADAYDQALAYFRQRYCADGNFTYHFHHLHLRPNDQEVLVRSVIDGSNNHPGPPRGDLHHRPPIPQQPVPWREMAI
jgi:hypothetical protein